MNLFGYLFAAAVALDVLRVGANKTAVRVPQLRWGFLVLWLAAVGYGSLVLLGLTIIFLTGILDMAPQGGLGAVITTGAIIVWLAHCIRTFRRILGLRRVVKLRLSERHKTLIRRYWLRSLVVLIFAAFVIWVNLLSDVAALS